MSDDNSLTWFDQLATETILEIFEYLSSNDIIYIFFYFNQRFNSILLHYQHCLDNFQIPTTNIYYWQNILSNIGSYMQHLIITTNDLCFSLDLFPNLKSLIISSTLPIGYSLLCSIFENEQFNKLTSFKIKSRHFYSEKDYQCMIDLIFKNIFHPRNSLQTVEYLSALCLCNSDDIVNLPANINIHSLSLTLNDFTDMLLVLDYTPNVKDLNLILFSMYTQQIFIHHQDLSKTKLEKFCLTLSETKGHIISEECFLRLMTFLKEFSTSLNYLSLNLGGQYIYQNSTFQFNGILLQEHLLKSMIELKTFHLYAKLKELPINVENVLSTFQNQFWFDHHWSIGMHEKYIYTLPFHFQQFDGFIDFDHIQSSNTKLLNSPSIWYYVRSLYLPARFKLNMYLIKQLKTKMSNLSTIIFTSSVNDFSSQTEGIDTDEDEIIQTNTTLESVTTVYFKDAATEHFQQWLINVLPNLKHLVLSDTYYFIPIVYNKIKRLKLHNIKFITAWKQPLSVYFPNLEYAEIELLHYGPYNFMKVLKNFINCKTLMVDFPGYKLNYAKQDQIDVNKMFNKLDLTEICKNYQIKYGYNCLEFVRKINE